MTGSGTFNILGSWEVRIGGHLVAIPSGQLRTLLASLLLADGEPVPVCTLTQQLWPERSPMRARPAASDGC
jgi:DNA-binding SARP family transcriptional activator